MVTVLTLVLAGLLKVLFLEAAVLQAQHSVLVSTAVVLVAVMTVATGVPVAAVAASAVTVVLVLLTTHHLLTSPLVEAVAAVLLALVSMAVLPVIPTTALTTLVYLDAVDAVALVLQTLFTLTVMSILCQKFLATLVLVKLVLKWKVIGNPSLLLCHKSLLFPLVHVMVTAKLNTQLLVGLLLCTKNNVSFAL